MRTILSLTLLLATGCSGGAPTEEPTPSLTPASPAAITLENRTAEPIAFFAAGEGALALLDISPRLEPGRYEHQVVAPGDAAPAGEIVGYDPALGVNFFIYRVDPATGAAYFARAHLATASAIARSNGVVRITTFDP